MTPLVSIVLVDASPDFRWLVRRALQREGGFDVVGDTDDDAVAVDVARAVQPHVVLLDVDRARDGEAAAAAVQQLRAGSPLTSVVATMSVGRRDVYDAVLAAQAVGVIRKSSSPQWMIRQLWSVLGATPPVAPHPAWSSVGEVVA